MRRKDALAFALLSFACTCQASFAKGAPDADNTAQNKGALNKNAITAEKQGNSKGEVQVTAEVRKAILAKGLSTNAQNIKIIYRQGGYVTLRGPVDSDEEKAKLEEVAKNCTGVSSVKSLITVKKRHA